MTPTPTVWPLAVSWKLIRIRRTRFWPSIQTSTGIRWTLVAFSRPATAACAWLREAAGSEAGTLSRSITAWYSVVWTPFTVALPTFVTVPAARR